MRRLGRTLATWAAFAAAAPLTAQTTPQALERYIEDSLARQQRAAVTPGSLFIADGFLADMARDPRASQVGDLITIVVAERASALSRGTLSQSRESENDASISRLFNPLRAGGALPNLFGQSNDSTLDGRGETTRQTDVTAVVTVHVTHVMPNGNLVIEGAKEVAVNAERQLVWLRGVVRQADLRQDNSVGSDRVAMLDLQVNGKGVVNSAIKRPNAVYRFFKSLLPF